MMKKRQIFSPYYDFKSFQYKNPYLKSPQSKSLSGGQNVSTSEEKNIPKRSRQSLEKASKHLNWEDLEKKEISDKKSCGDCVDLRKQEESLEDLSAFRPLNSSNRSCQTVEVKKQTGPKRVTSQTFSSLNHQLMNRKENQNTLRYLLKISNNTFYATLKHEIEMTKKKEKSFEQNQILHSQSILKVLEFQNQSKETFRQISSQNQKLKVDLEQQKLLLNNLVNEIQDLKLKSSNRSKFQEIQVETNLLSSNLLKSYADMDSPQSAPSIVPEHLKEKKQVRYSSEPAIVFHSGSAGSGNSQNRRGKDFEIDSLFETKFSNCSNFLSDITCSKTVSIKSSLVQVETRNIGTNYSTFDFEASEVSSQLVLRNKKKGWSNFFCCR